MLESRQIAISETLGAAKNYVLNLPENEYFALCIKLAVANAVEGAGEMLFNAKDKKRLPESFANLLSLSLPERKSLTISETTIRIDGGFVLKYGEMEENCSISAIFRQRHDEFVDLISEPLFGEAV
jgi:V/A-type H+-transporting ATPase subunit E